MKQDRSLVEENLLMIWLSLGLPAVSMDTYGFAGILLKPHNTIEFVVF